MKKKKKKSEKTHLENFGLATNLSERTFERNTHKNS